MLILYAFALASFPGKQKGLGTRLTFAYDKDTNTKGPKAGGSMGIPVLAFMGACQLNRLFCMSISFFCMLNLIHLPAAVTPSTVLLC